MRLAPQPQQLVAHQQPGLLVERAERLVEQNEPRLQHQGARDAHALAHSAGELRRIGAGECLKPHEGDRVGDAGANLGGRDAGAAQAERDVVPYVEPREARILLEHDADPGGDLIADRLALEADGTVGRSRQAGERLEQRGLAATGRAHDGDEFAGAKIEIERPERMDAAVAGFEDLGDPAQPRAHLRHAGRRFFNGSWPADPAARNSNR